MRRRNERRLHFLETSYCGKWGENCNGKESCGNVQHLTAVNTLKKTRRSLESSTAAVDSKDNSREASAFTKKCTKKSSQKIGQLFQAAGIIGQIDPLESIWDPFTVL